MNLLPRRRSSRDGRGRGNLVIAGDFPDSEAVTDAMNALPPWDGTTLPAAPSAVIFEGASDIGLMPAAAEPPAMLRARPPAFGHAGYAPDATGPLPVITMTPAIGNALARDDQWGPKFTPVPCGHCGTPPPVPYGILDRARAIGHVNWRAYQAGWKHDTDLILTCPQCQEGDAWKARQGQLAVPGGPRRAAVLAIDVMLTSKTYPDVRTLFAAAEERNRKRFGFLRRGKHAGGPR